MSQADIRSARCVLCGLCEPEVMHHGFVRESLKVPGFDDFLVGSGGQRVIDLKVDELRDHPNGTIGKDELSASRVVTTEIFEVADGTVRDMIGGPNDARGRFTSVVDHAVPNRSAQTTAPLADHQGLA